MRCKNAQKTMVLPVPVGNTTSSERASRNSSLGGNSLKSRSMISEKRVYALVSASTHSAWYGRKSTATALELERSKSSCITLTRFRHLDRNRCLRRMDGVCAIPHNTRLLLRRLALALVFHFV